jgi:hypothetical protein
MHSLSVFDNPWLPQETVDSLLRTFPPDHPKHRTMVLGQRGLNVEGEPIYEETFVRGLHVRPIELDPTAPLLEAIDCGKRNPAWVICQQPYSGGIYALAGIIGQEMILDDFLPLVRQYRTEWFGELVPIKTCCDPAGKITEQSTRYTSMYLLRQAGFRPQAREDANGVDVRYAMQQRLAAYMRRRGPSGKESFGVNDNPRRWLKVSKDGPVSMPFVAFALEAGYVYDKNTISVSNKEYQPSRKDDWYEHGMNCLELIECNFGANRLTREERATVMARQRARYQQSLVVRGSGMDWAAG